MAKIGLDRSGIDAVVGQLEAAGVAQHVRVDLHIEPEQPHQRARPSPESHVW